MISDGERDVSEGKWTFFFSFLFSYDVYHWKELHLVYRFPRLIDAFILSFFMTKGIAYQCWTFIRLLHKFHHVDFSRDIKRESHLYLDKYLVAYLLAYRRIFFEIAIHFLKILILHSLVQRLICLIFLSI